MMKRTKNTGENQKIKIYCNRRLAFSNVWKTSESSQSDYVGYHVSIKIISLTWPLVLQNKSIFKLLPNASEIEFECVAIIITCIIYFSSENRCCVRFESS